MEAGLGDFRFWAPLLGGFVIAWPFAFAVNRAMIRSGKRPRSGAPVPRSLTNPRRRLAPSIASAQTSGGTAKPIHRDGHEPSYGRPRGQRLRGGERVEAVRRELVRVDVVAQVAFGGALRDQVADQFV